MDRSTFTRLCEMTRDVGGLKSTKNSSLDEIMTLFLYTLAHHKKSSTISLFFHWSMETVLESKESNNHTRTLSGKFSSQAYD
ncbi:hypothetical protein ACS0TY_018224 [Phlomoides rotata]